MDSLMLDQPQSASQPRPGEGGVTKAAVAAAIAKSQATDKEVDEACLICIREYLTRDPSLEAAVISELGHVVSIHYDNKVIREEALDFIRLMREEKSLRATAAEEIAKLGVSKKVYFRVSPIGRALMSLMHPVAVAPKGRKSR